VLKETQHTFCTVLIRGIAVLIILLFGFYVLNEIPASGERQVTLYEEAIPKQTGNPYSQFPEEDEVLHYQRIVC